MLHRWLERHGEPLWGPKASWGVFTLHYHIVFHISPCSSVWTSVFPHFPCSRTHNWRGIYSFHPNAPLVQSSCSSASQYQHYCVNWKSGGHSRSDQKAVGKTFFFLSVNSDQGFSSKKHCANHLPGHASACRQFASRMHCSREMVRWVIPVFSAPCGCCDLPCWGDGFLAFLLSPVSLTWGWSLRAEAAIKMQRRELSQHGGRWFADRVVFTVSPSQEVLSHRVCSLRECLRVSRRMKIFASWEREV